MFGLFGLYEGQKTKKGQKKLLPNEKSNKKIFTSQIFFDLCDLGAWWSSTLVAFFWEKSGFWGSRKLVLKKVWATILCFFVSCSLPKDTACRWFGGLLLLRWGMPQLHSTPKIGQWKLKCKICWTVVHKVNIMLL